MEKLAPVEMGIIPTELGAFHKRIEVKRLTCGNGDNIRGV